MAEYKVGSTFKSKWVWVRYLAIIVCVVLSTCLLYWFNVARYLSLMTDSAGYVDLIKSVSKGQGMVSPVFSSAYSIFPLLAAFPDKYCNSEFSSLYRETNFSTWHPYLITYPISWLAWLLGTSSLKVSALVNALNMTAGGATVFLYLRTRGVTLISSLVFLCALIFFQPVAGHIFGQFYFDRLLFFPGLLLMLAMAGDWPQGKYRPVIIAVAFLICTLISERGALIFSAVSLSYWLIEDRLSFRVKNMIWLVLGILGFIYLYIYMKHYQNSLYYTAISLNGAIQNFKASVIPGGWLHELTIKWAVIILPYVILSLPSFRGVILVMIAMVPNLLVTVGGAEKTGFLTHYHAGYLPILVGGATVGFAQLFNQQNSGILKTLGELLKKKQGLLFKIIAASIPVLLVLYNVSINIIDPGKLLAFNNIHNVKSEFSAIIPNSGQREALDARAEFLKNFVSDIPRDAAISSPENMMPALVMHGNRIIDYMPIGVGINDYLIAEYTEPDNVLIIPSYRNPSDRLLISECVQKKIGQQYSAVKSVNSYGMTYVLYHLNGAQK